MEEMEGGYQMLMSKLIIVFVLNLFMLLGCQSNKKQPIDVLEKEIVLPVLQASNPNTKSVPTQEKDDGFIHAKKVLSVVPDTTINNKLFLENYKSLSNFYLSDKSLSLVERLRESPVVIFGNKSKKEYLLAYQYEGNMENAYSCFEIGYFENDKNIIIAKYNQTDETNFETESGLRLGLSLEDVIHIKGREYEQLKSDDYTELNYNIKNYESSIFLKKYNMPGYFIKIKLKSNRVTNIIIGFDYP